MQVAFYLELYMAKKNTHQYSLLTIKRLYGLSGNRCAFPDCTVTFVNQDEDTNLSQICHIEDANPNLYKSDRYNPNMTDEERKDYKNLILLCPNHHVETNNTQIYTVDALRQIKRNHEDKIRQIIAEQNLISKNPSVLNVVINHIGTTVINDTVPTEPMTAPDPQDKITYNNIIRYKPIIEEYKVYQGRLNKIYEEIERQGSAKKEFLLRNIKNIYLKEKGKYNNIEDIRRNADLIIEAVEHELWEKFENNNDNPTNNIPVEAIEIGILIILVDAFMRCNILEEPPQS